TTHLVAVVELLELGSTDGCGDFRHPEVVAEDVMVISLSGAMLAEHPDLLGDPVVISGDHPAFAGRDVLRRIEGKGGVNPESAGFAAVDSRPMRLTRVLDQYHPAPVRQLAQLVDRGGMTVEVDGHDRPGAR